MRRAEKRRRRMKQRTEAFGMKDEEKRHDRRRTDEVTEKLEEENTA